jgi:hypothetical protein
MAGLVPAVRGVARSAIDDRIALSNPLVAQAQTNCSESSRFVDVRGANELLFIYRCCSVLEKITGTKTFAPRAAHSTSRGAS